MSNKTERIQIRLSSSLLKQIREIIKAHPERWLSMSDFFRGVATREIRELEREKDKI